MIDVECGFGLFYESNNIFTIDIAFLATIYLFVVELRWEIRMPA